MRLLPPLLLQKLSRSRLLTSWVTAASGVGEKRSRAKGAGIEFAEHRPYQVGDDIRYLDRHVFDRLGTNYIKQYEVYQQVPVTILLDGSVSMAYGQPQKWHCAMAIAAGFAYVALAGGDSVLVGVIRKGRVHWSSSVQGTGRAPRLFQWLEQQRPRGSTNLAATMHAVMPRLHGQGLTFVISDWMFDGVENLLTSLRLAKQEVIGIHVLAPEEVEPERLGRGNVKLVDLEDGQEVEMALDPTFIEKYKRELQGWSDELKDKIYASRGRYLQVRSDDDLDRLFLRDWRNLGLIA